MQINPGGLLDTKDVVGRDKEIARYWQVLERQGLILSAERRIGKTHIVLKMREECQGGYLPFYQDLEAVHSIMDLIRSIYNIVQNASNTPHKLKLRIAKWSSLFPTKIAGVELPTSNETWQVLLSSAFDDLFSLADDKVTLMLSNEFPLMLHNLQRREGSDLAIQLLDHLRALRATHSDRLRFLFTGSIGLHLVLRSLRREGNANDPVNDMLSLTVPPLTHSDTCHLAEALLRETRAVPAEVPQLAAQIASEVSGFPYYIHHVVDQLFQLPRAPTMEDVSTAVDNLVYSSHDPANLNYYVSRLSTYYSDAERAMALLVLDTLASLSSPASVSELLNLCRHRDATLEEEQLRETLKIAR